MVVTGNLTTSIIGLGRSINNFTFSIPANNGPSLILIDNILILAATLRISLVCARNTALLAVMAMG
jgi:hypothetical protein